MQKYENRYNNFAFRRELKIERSELWYLNYLHTYINTHIYTSTCTYIHTYTHIHL